MYLWARLAIALHLVALAGVAAYGFTRPPQQIEELAAADAVDVPVSHVFEMGKGSAEQRCGRLGPLILCIWDWAKI